MAKPPPPIETQSFCPLIGQKCIEGACTFWIQIWGTVDDGPPQLDEDCTFNWQTTLASEQLRETVRVSAGTDKVANETNLLGRVIGAGIVQKREAIARVNDES